MRWKKRGEDKDGDNVKVKKNATFKNRISFKYFKRS